MQVRVCKNAILYLLFLQSRPITSVSNLRILLLHHATNVIIIVMIFSRVHRLHVFNGSCYSIPYRIATNRHMRCVSQPTDIMRCLVIYLNTDHLETTSDIILFRVGIISPDTKRIINDMGWPVHGLSYSDAH